MFKSVALIFSFSLFLKQVSGPSHSNYLMFLARGVYAPVSIGQESPTKLFSKVGNYALYS
jgi:hypothetical protein